MEKLQTRKGRDKTGTYLVEGFHLVEEALRQDGLVLELLVSNGVSVPEEWLKAITMYLKLVQKSAT